MEIRFGYEAGRHIDTISPLCVRCVDFLRTAHIADCKCRQFVDCYWTFSVAMATAAIVLLDCATVQGVHRLFSRYNLPLFICLTLNPNNPVMVLLNGF
jgi:hypothetical protein